MNNSELEKRIRNNDLKLQRMINNNQLSYEVNVDNPYFINYIAIFFVVSFGLLCIYFSIKNGEPIISLIISIFIASISLFIALNANINTKKTARANLLGVIRNLFNSRYTFFRNIHNLELQGDIGEKKQLNKLARQYMEFATWDCVLCLKQVTTLRKWADQEDINRLANSVHILIYNVLNQKSKNILKNRHVEHLLKCCKHMNDIGISEVYTYKVINEFEKHSKTEKDNTESFQDYINRKSKEVKTDPAKKLKSQDYLDELFVGFK